MSGTLALFARHCSPTFVFDNRMYRLSQNRYKVFEVTASRNELAIVGRRLAQLSCTENCTKSEAERYRHAGFMGYGAEIVSDLSDEGASRVDRQCTGFDAGLSGDEQIRIALRCMVDGGGSAEIQQIYDAVENAISPARLSDQGRASLRYFVNRCAVQAGYVRPYDRSDPGWHITVDGREYAASEQEPPEVVHNVETQVDEVEASNTVRGAAFERYALELLKRLFPGATWFHQGSRKQFERGLDLVGTPLGEMHGPPQRIGVQVKFHAAQHAPTDQEWEKFLAGCTLRRIAKPVFITTGRLTSRQRRDASEAGIEVIEGQDEVTRVAERYGLKRFELLDDD